MGEEGSATSRQLGNTAVIIDGASTAWSDGMRSPIDLRTHAQDHPTARIRGSG